MNDFFRRQVTDISAGGASTVLRKLGLVVLVPAALLVVVIVRLLRPFIQIRFGPLVSFRIGHYSANTETYLTERDAGLHGRRALDIFYDLPPVCNQQLGRMWRRIIPISPLAALPDRLNRLIPGGKAHTIPFRFYQGRDVNGVLAGTDPHLSFTADEEEKGLAGLQELGIDDGAEFICIMGRDQTYLNSADPKRDWGYHNFRNVDIQSYLLAAEELTKLGHYVVRVGSKVEHKFETSNPKIIDYATGCTNDFMDIFMAAKCRFFVSCNTGLDGVSSAFRRPLVGVSVVPLEWSFTWDSEHVMIPKRLWLRSENRYLTFREILHSDIGHYRQTDFYENHGIELQENSPQEIAEVTLEMENRVNGTWVEYDDDEELQSRYHSLFLPSDLHGVHHSRIGAQFLRQNRHLLD